jgi:hypothetical protein
MPIAAVVADLEGQRSESFVEWIQDGRRFCLRRATTLDLLESLEAPSTDAAEEIVAMRCLSVDDAPPKETALAVSPDVRANFDRLHARTIVSFRLVCSQCDQTFAHDLDVPRFVWTEVRHAARALLGDIHLLASHYGWSEREIANMSPQRRAVYKEMLSA